MAITADMIGAYASFTIYPAAILGNAFNRVKILAIYSARIAQRFADVAALHANVYPTLPPGSGELYTDYSYVEVEMPSGQTAILGIPWIVTSTFTLHTNSQAQFVVSNINPGDVEIIRQQIIAAGYTDITATLLN